MKIILLKKVSKLGHVGDIKEVSNGYARNFLLPNGLADIATKYSVNVKEAQKKKLIKTKQLEEKSKKQAAKNIDGKKIIILVKADDKGTLYAGLNKQAIADEINIQGYKINADELILKKVVKKLGNFDAELKIAGEKVKIILEIKQDQDNIR